MTKKKGSKQNVIGKMQRLSAGLRQNLSGQLMVLAGESMKVADLLTEFDAYVAQLNGGARGLARAGRGDNGHGGHCRRRARIVAGGLSPHLLRTDQRDVGLVRARAA